MTDAPILEMLNISKAFGGVQALRDVSFSCRKGKVHALLGENGAGKSTLIKILAGAYQADSGEIVFKGQRYAGFTAREAMATGISIIYQELNLVQLMTVAENIFLGREPRNRLGVIDTRRMAKESAALLEPAPHSAFAVGAHRRFDRRQPADGRNRQSPVAERRPDRHGRTFGDSRRTGTRQPVRHYSFAGRAGRDDHLHLAPA